jgi:hypothetical protein
MSGSGCPAVRCPAVRCPAVRCPVIWLGRPGSGCPADWCPPVRPVTSVSSGSAQGVALGITSVRQATVTAGTDRVARGLRCPERLGRRPESAWRGATVRRWWGGRWGSGGHGLGRVGLGRRLRPCSTADRPGGGQPGVRVAGGCRLSQAWERGSKPGVPAPECGRHLGLEHDYAAWSLWSLMARWTGWKGPTSSTVRMRRGPSAAQPGSERDRLGADNAMTCANSGGRDRV